MNLEEIAIKLEALSQGQAAIEASIASLTQSVQSLTLEVQALRREKVASQRVWFSPSEAEPMLGLSSYAIRSRIKSGDWLEWTQRKAHGCWRIKAGGNGRKTAYEVHIDNWKKQADLLSDRSRQLR